MLFSLGRDLRALHAALPMELVIAVPLAFLPVRQAQPPLDQLRHVLEEFRQLVLALVEGGRTALVFSCWERMTRLAARELDELGTRYVRFHGRLSLRERRRLVDEFMGDAGCLLFLSTDAGGLGLNLQAASTVVNLDLPWNPAVLDQPSFRSSM